MKEKLLFASLKLIVILINFILKQKFITQECVPELLCK
jgi:hypothetical protein